MAHVKYFDDEAEAIVNKKLIIGLTCIFATISTCYADYKAGDLIGGCTVLRNQIFGMPARNGNEVAAADYCTGLLKGMLQAKFSGCGITPGFSAKGVVAALVATRRDLEAKGQWYPDSSAANFLAEAFKLIRTEKSPTGATCLAKDNLAGMAFIELSD